MSESNLHCATLPWFYYCLMTDWGLIQDILHFFLPIRESFLAESNELFGFCCLCGIGIHAECLGIFQLLNYGF